MRDRMIVCMRNWAWLCPWAMLGSAAVVLILFGVSAWTAFLVTILLVCPAVVVWGAIRVRRRSREG